MKGVDRMMPPTRGRNAGGVYLESQNKSTELLIFSLFMIAGVRGD